MTRTEAIHRASFLPTKDNPPHNLEWATVQWFGMHTLGKITSTEEWRGLRSAFRPGVDRGEFRTVKLRRGKYGFTATIELLARDDSPTADQTESYAVQVSRSSSPEGHLLPTHDASFGVIVHGVRPSAFGGLLPVAPVMSTASGDIQYSGSRKATDLRKTFSAIRKDFKQFFK